MLKRKLFVHTAIILAITLILPGCFSFNKRFDSPSETVAEGDKSLVIKVTQSGDNPIVNSPGKSEMPASTSSKKAVNNKNNISPSRNISAQRASSSITKSDIRIFLDDVVAPIDGNSYVWDSERSVITIPSAGKGTYTVDIAKAARFSVPCYDDRETYAEAEIPETVKIEDSGIAEGYVRVGVKVLEFRKSSDADTKGSFISFYRYYTEAKTGFDRKLPDLFEPEDVDLYRWKDVKDIPGVTNYPGGTSLSLGNVKAGAYTVVNENTLGDEFVALSSKTALEEAISSTSSLIYEELSAVTDLFSVASGSVVSANADSILSAISTIASNRFEILDIIALRSSSDISSAKTTTTTDSDLDYGDTAYFAIITKDEETLTNHTLKVSAVINSISTGDPETIVWSTDSSGIPITVASANLITGQTDIWSNDLMKLPVTVENIREGFMKIKFIVNDRGTILSVDKTFVIKSGTAIPERAQLTISGSRAKGTTGSDALIPENYTASVNPSALRNNFILFHPKNANEENGVIYFKVETVKDDLTDILSEDYSLFPDVSTAWSDYLISNENSTATNIDYIGYWELPLSVFHQDTIEMDVLETSSKPGLKLFYDSEENTYGIGIIKPTGTNHDCGVSDITALLRGSSGSVSDTVTYQYVVYGGDYTVTAARIDPTFSLYWGRNSYDDLSADDMIEGTREVANLKLYMKTDAEDGGTSGFPDVKDLLFYINVEDSDGNPIHTNYDSKYGYAIPALYSPTNSATLNGSTLEVGDTGLMIKKIGNYHTYIYDVDGLTLEEDKKYTVTVISRNVAGQTYKVEKEWDTGVVVPSISSVTTSKADGTYGEDEIIDIEVEFTDTVLVTGTPKLTLATGGDGYGVSYTSGSNSNTLLFRYTVLTGHGAADLDYTSSSALTLEDGTIKDSAGRDASLFLPTPGSSVSLGGSKAIVIDTNAPAISKVTSDKIDGSYRETETINIQVIFSSDVTVNTAGGTPYIILNTGSDYSVSYSSGSGSNTLVFQYTVQAGHASSDLDYASTEALILNSGTIKDSRGNNATLTLATPGSSGSLGAEKALVIDTAAPAVSGVTSSSADGTYITGQTIEIQIQFTEPVVVDAGVGTPPQLTLDLGAGYTVDYKAGSGSSIITFDYVVQGDQIVADLDYASTTALAVNDGTIADPAGNTAVLTLASPGASNSLGDNKDLSINTTTTSVVNITSDKTDGSYREGEIIGIKVQFSKNVTVTGVPQLTLGTGGAGAVVSFTSATADTLLFNYSVGAGQNSLDLEYASTAALSLNGGTIKDGAGNDAALTLPATGSTGSLSYNKDIIIDTTVPVVTNVTSNKIDGTYKENDEIIIQVSFSEVLAVDTGGGTPLLTLDTGGGGSAVSYTSGSGSVTLEFTYTVGAGETSGDLDYLNTSALSANGGTLKDAAGNDATLTLASPGAAGSLGANKNLVIDTTAPTVSNVTSTKSNGTYGIGTSIPVQLTFTEIVSVSGTPQLTLNTGGAGTAVDYSSGSGTDTLTFNYVVSAGHTAADLDYYNTTALQLNGGSIKDAAGNDATLTLVSPGAAGSLGDNKALVIETVQPTVSNVTSSSANDVYTVGESITVQIEFTENVFVTGTPNIRLATGGAGTAANFSGGSSSSTLEFTYIVQSGNTSSDLDYLNTTSLTLNSGTIKDAAGNDAVLTLVSPGAAGSLGDNKAILIDTAAPSVSSVNSTKADGMYSVGETMEVQVYLNETVYVTGTPQLKLATGGTGYLINYTSGSASNTLTFYYEVQGGHSTGDLDYYSTTALSLNGGSIKDAAGNDAILTLASPGAVNSLGASKAIVINAVVPVISSVSSPGTNGIYTTGGNITIEVTFSETIIVDTGGGTPYLTLDTGGGGYNVAYTSGSNSLVLQFYYTVQAGHNSSDLEYLNTSSLVLNGGTIKDIAANDANITLPTVGGSDSLAGNKAFVIDTTAPTVSNVTSSVSDGSYNAGDTMEIQVVFSESVTVNTGGGTPTLTLDIGGGTALNYDTGSGSNTLSFIYTVQAGHNSADLDYQTVNDLALNGGTIVDDAGNNSVNTLAAPGGAGSLGGNKAIVIDTTASTVSGVDSTKADGTYASGENIDIQVTFDETVVVDTAGGTPTLSLNAGGGSSASYISGSSSNVLTFRYTVQAGHDAADLDYLNTTSLALNSGTIKDLAGNAATLTLASPGAAGSLGANRALVIDTTAPTVTDVNSDLADGTYGVGTNIDIKVIFDDTVSVSGTPQLTVSVGSDYAVNYLSGSGSNTLVFRYKVLSSHASADLDYSSTSALSLNGGTINDTVGNGATLTLASPGAANSLGANKAIVVETTAPAVSNVTAAEADNTYGIAATINIQVLFNDTVEVSGGTPTLSISTSAGSISVNNSSGSGSNTLVFQYIVSAGQNSSDLAYASTTALSLNGSTIKDTSGNSAVITLPSPGAANSLSNNKQLVIDGTAPSITNVSTTSSNGSYSIDETVEVQIVFSEAVTVNTGGGTPTLKLATGGAGNNVNYLSGTGTTKLIFRYVVLAGQSASDLDYVDSASLVLNSGTIKDAAGNDASLTLPVPGNAGSLSYNKDIVVDTVLPVVSSVSSSASDGTFKAGSTIPVKVTFSEAVTVDTGGGTPSMNLDLGGGYTVNYSYGSGTTVLVFNYTVQAGQNSTDLDYVDTSSLALNSGTIKDAAGNAATLTLAAPGAAGSLGANKAIVIDTTSPTVSGVDSDAVDQGYCYGGVIDIKVIFSETVTVTGNPSLGLSVGSNYSAYYYSGSGSNSLVFRYMVQNGHTSADLDYASTEALILNSGTIKDAIGNAATLTLAAPGAANSLGDNKAIVIDTTSPAVTDVTSDKANGTYGDGTTMNIQVVFDEVVNVTGTPKILLDTGGSGANALYLSGSGSNTVVFGYTVEVGHVASDLDYSSTSAITTVSSTIKDAAGNNADTTLATPGAANSLGANKALVVETTSPKIVNVTSAKANGTYKATETIDITVAFDENVTVVTGGGTPTLKLATGGSGYEVNYSGSASNVLTFSYVVQSGHVSADLDYYSTSALALNGGTIKDAAGNDADLTLPPPGWNYSLGANKALVIDALAPTVTSITASTGNGTFGTGSTVEIQVYFSETVTVTPTPQLTLNVGASYNVNYKSGSDSNILVFQYVVLGGHNSADLDYAATNSLGLNGGSIVDAVGNAAVLTLPAPGDPGSLSANRNIVITP